MMMMMTTMNDKDNKKFLKKFKKSKNVLKQGRIHGYPSRVRVGRSLAGEGHWVIWARAICSKSLKTPKKGTDRPTDGPT